MDLNKIRERLESLTNQNKPSASKQIWKPQPGSQVIRIVPYVHNKDWPFLELLFYYDLAKKTIISPQNFNQPDPVQELADKLKGTGEREDWLLARKIEPKMRTYVPILVRGQEHEGVKFWGFGKTVYEELLKTIDDPDYGNITDLKNGTDITVEYEKAADGSYPKTSFRVKRNTSPATTDPEVIKLLKEMPTVKDIWEPPTYEELADLLDKFINNTAEEDAAPATDDDEDLPTSDFLADPLNPLSGPIRVNVPSAKKSAPAAAVTNDIDAAFDEMFG